MQYFVRKITCNYVLFASTALFTALMKDHPNTGVWIGLNDRSTFRKFTWTDGTDLDYTNWGAGQPDGQIYRPVSCLGSTWLIFSLINSRPSCPRGGGLKL